MAPFSLFQRTGRAGEQRAKRFLQLKGYRILTENFLCRQGEVDLIAERKGWLVFCEVKTRSSSRFGTAAESITQRKLTRLQRAAASYRQQHKDWRPFRFEAVLITMPETGGTLIEHLTEL